MAEPVCLYGRRGEWKTLNCAAWDGPWFGEDTEQALVIYYCVF